MLIMFSLFGGRKGDLDPLQGAGVASRSRCVLAKGSVWPAGGPSESPQDWGAARDLVGRAWVP